MMSRRCCGVRDTVGWLLPAAILTVLPKCPACLALYIGIGTGIGLSLPTAIYVRAMLVILCTFALLYMAARRLH